METPTGVILFFSTCHNLPGNTSNASNTASTVFDLEQEQKWVKLKIRVCWYWAFCIF